MKYMVIIWTDEGQEAFFTDDAKCAERTRMDADVSMGFYAEVYERIEGECGREYVFAWN